MTDHFVRASHAWDSIVKKNRCTDTMVSRDMVYGVVEIRGEWFHVCIRHSDPAEVDELFPDARDKSMDDIEI